MQATVPRFTRLFLFCTAIPDEILLISGFKRGEKRGRGKKKNTCKISPQSNRFRDSNIYIPVYIPRWYREASGFRFFSRSFQNATKWKCNRKVIPTSIPLAYMCARMRVCSTHVFNGPSIHIHFPFRFECIALHSDVERGATRFFLYFLIAPPSWFSAVFPPPLPLFPRVCINFFFFFRKKKKRIVVRSTKHLLSIRVHGRSNPARSVVKRNRLEKYRGWRDIDINRINSRRSQFPRDRVDLSSRIKEGGLYLFFWSNQKLRGVIRSCIFQGTLTDESKGNISRQV